MTWSHTGKNFQVQWKALEDKKNIDQPDVPEITKTLTLIKCKKAFRYYLHCRVGARTIPLSYVVRSDAEAPPIGASANGKPHSD